MNSQILLIVGGGIVGFMCFFIGTATMEGIFFRPDPEGNMKLNCQTFPEYLKAPFMIKSSTFKTVWALLPNINLKTRAKLLNLNWVFMTALGSTVGFLIGKSLL